MTEKTDAERIAAFLRDARQVPSDDELKRWTLVDAVRELHAAKHRIAALERAIVAMVPGFISTVRQQSKEQL